VAKLKLKSPLVPSPGSEGSEWEIVDVAVDAPVPHLDGIYSYRAPKGNVNVGSVVKVPFGQGESYGFVVAQRDESSADRGVKRILALLHDGPLFNTDALSRYQKIAADHGSSLFSIISAANPAWRSRGVLKAQKRAQDDMTPSKTDRGFIERLFGADWKRSSTTNLLIPTGVLWDHIAVSLFLANPISTLILVPTERSLRYLDESLRKRGVTSHVQLSSSMTKSARGAGNRAILSDSPLLVIGTRGAALAPYKPERVIIIDPGDENHRERRSPHFQVDDGSIWSDADHVITLSHVRNLETLSKAQPFVIGRRVGKMQFQSTSVDRVVADITKVKKQLPMGAWVLVSLNDKSFASGLICSTCRNRGSCDCGFPLAIPRRGEDPRCTKCLKEHSVFVCKHCKGSHLVAIRGGSEALALSVAKSIKGARTIVSNSNSPKDEIVAGSESTVVIATQGCEPRIRSEDGKRSGYDGVVMLGGRAAFASPSLARSDRFRMAWGRLLGLVNIKEASFFVDLEMDHPAFIELREPGNARGLPVILHERKELNLPPYSTLVELRGEERVLQKLRLSLESDQIFQNPENVIFPVHDGRMILKVKRDQRMELNRLLQELVRLRSAKRLPRIDYTYDPEDM